MQHFKETQSGCLCVELGGWDFIGIGAEKEISLRQYPGICVGGYIF